MTTTTESTLIVSDGVESHEIPLPFFVAALSPAALAVGCRHVGLHQLARALERALADGDRAELARITDAARLGYALVREAHLIEERLS